MKQPPEAARFADGASLKLHSKSLNKLFSNKFCAQNAKSKYSWLISPPLILGGIPNRLNNLLFKYPFSLNYYALHIAIQKPLLLLLIPVKDFF